MSAYLTLESILCLSVAPAHMIVLWLGHQWPCFGLCGYCPEWTLDLNQDHQISSLKWSLRWSGCRRVSAYGWNQRTAWVPCTRRSRERRRREKELGARCGNESQSSSETGGNDWRSGCLGIVNGFAFLGLTHAGGQTALEWDGKFE